LKIKCPEPKNPKELKSYLFWENFEEFLEIFSKLTFEKKVFPKNLTRYTLRYPFYFYRNFHEISCSSGFARFCLA
jgi:hypothetical protein